ncbi:Hypp6826 [Branchiostoma lanceolatum]|uniref:Hypp6826 protein n=1 Tax=Branchiostoma lanceolatum TaxID=7740 RepID=A0A8J9YVL0_BRALA|nr:Hypp6826 [Branchiostoma lanceolatum]
MPMINLFSWPGHPTTSPRQQHLDHQHLTPRPQASSSNTTTPAEQPTSSNSTAPPDRPAPIPGPSDGTECPECFLNPCVMAVHGRRAGMRAALLHQRQPNPKNSGVRKAKYKTVWGQINMRGGWKDERHLRRKPRRMLDDGFHIVKRDVMPSVRWT